MTIHRGACPRALTWIRHENSGGMGTTSETQSYHRCFICMRTQDKPGVLAEVTAALSSCNANVHKAEAKISADLTGILEFELGVKDLDHLELVINKLENLNSIVSVKRKILSSRDVSDRRHS